MTNLALTTVNRLRVFNGVDDHGGRGDGIPVYNYTLTNCVVTAPARAVHVQLRRSLFYGFTGMARPFVASVITVSNATNLRRPKLPGSGWGANRGGIYGLTTDRRLQHPRCHRRLGPKGGVMPTATAPSRLTSTSRFVVQTLPSQHPRTIQRALGHGPDKFAVQIVIEGETEPVFPQFIISDSITVGDRGAAPSFTLRVCRIV